MPVPQNSAEILEFSLGGFKLDTFEVPEEFEIGHDVQVAVHKFIDEAGRAKKHVHAMGAFPIATKWTGELYGASALHRNYIFDNLATQQQEITWTFGPLNYTVLIKSYRGKVKHQNLVLYSLELEIIDDNNGTTQALDGTAQFNQEMDKTYQDAVNQMQKVTPYDGDLSNITIAHSDLTSKVQKLQPLQFASMSDLQGLLQQVNAFKTQVSAYLLPLQELPLTSQALGTFNNLTGALNSYTLFATNLQQICGGPVASALQKKYQAGTNLFAVAAHHYPDQDIPSTAQAIATANGLTSMFLTTEKTLNIPPIFKTGP